MERPAPCSPRRTRRSGARPPHPAGWPQPSRGAEPDRYGRTKEALERKPHDDAELPLRLVVGVGGLLERSRGDPPVVVAAEAVRGDRAGEEVLVRAGFPVR